MFSGGASPRGEKTYLYYGDALKEKFDLYPDGSIDSREELTLKETFDEFYDYDCNEIRPDPYEPYTCTSLTLARDTLSLNEARKNSAERQSMGMGMDGDGSLYDCHLMDANKAAQILQKHSEAVQRETDKEEQEKQEQLRRNKM